MEIFSASLRPNKAGAILVKYCIKNIKRGGHFMLLELGNEIFKFYLSMLTGILFVLNKNPILNIFIRPYLALLAFRITISYMIPRLC